MGINALAFLSQVVTFLILLWILQRWAFPALLKTLDARERTIREGVENAEAAKQQLADAEKRVQELLDQARRDAQNTLAKAQQAAEHTRQDIENDARRRAGEIIEQAEKRVDQQVAQARVQLRQEVADLAIRAAEHVVGSTLDPAASRRLVNDFVAQTRDLQC